MKESPLQKLIENTFAKIASPLKGNGVYAEIQKAVLEAYSLGAAGKRMLAGETPEEKFNAIFSE